MLFDIFFYLGIFFLDSFEKFVKYGKLYIVLFYVKYIESVGVCVVLIWYFYEC